MKKLNVWYRRAAVALGAIACCVSTASAVDTGGFDAPAKNLIELVFVFIKYGGILLVIWGLVQFFMAMNNHDSTQKMAGVWMIFAGIAMFFLKSILSTIGITW